MSRKVVVISQNSEQTVLKCPKCSGKIVLTHGGYDIPNGEIGRLDIGEQHYTAVVCMNRRPSTDRHCDFSADLHLETLRWGKEIHILGRDK